MAEPVKTAHIFPGQGSQSVGMGRDLFDNFDQARAIFQQADETLKFPLSRLCFEGPEEELRLTINAQPALLTVSFACLRCAGGKLSPPAFLAGHSLGEYTAIAAADVLDFKTAVFLARERGRLMYEAGLARPGGMAAVIGLDENSLAKVCQETDTEIANLNSPGQIVISGAKENLGKAMELAKTRGASRVIPLAVSGAFHSRLMQPAADGLSKIIATLDFHNPTIPIIANAKAEPLTTAQEVKSELITQLCHPVQWQRSIEYMINNGVSTFIEIGPGKVLSGLVKRINKELNTLNIGDIESIRSLK